MNLINNIDIFTDGGVFEDGKYVISTGVVFFNKKQCLKFNYNTHNKNCTFAEIMAIKKALSKFYGYVRQNNIDISRSIINIYSDSLVVVRIMESGLYNGYCPDRIFASYVFNEMLELIDKMGIPVSVYHIRSHTDKKDIKRNRKIFCHDNGCTVTLDEFKFIWKQNKTCDSLVRRNYEKAINSKAN